MTQHSNPTKPANPAGQTPISPRITTRRLSKYFGRFTALDALDLTIEPGEYVMLLGRNGAGKTTLLRTLGLLLRPSRGELFFNGNNSEKLEVDFRRHIGFVAHETYLYDELSVEENLAFFARLYGLPQPEQRIGEVLEEMDLAHRRPSLARSLSRGLRQRLTLARAWLHKPGLILLDEPTTGLDAPTRARMHGWLANCHRQGHTIILSSHELSEGLQNATRLLLLEDGRAVHDLPNSPENLATVQKHLRAEGTPQ